MFFTLTKNLKYGRYSSGNDVTLIPLIVALYFFAINCIKHHLSKTSEGLRSWFFILRLPRKEERSNNKTIVKLTYG